MAARKAFQGLILSTSVHDGDGSDVAERLLRDNPRKAALLTLRDAIRRSVAGGRVTGLSGAWSMYREDGERRRPGLIMFIYTPETGMSEAEAASALAMYPGLTGYALPWAGDQRRIRVMPETPEAVRRRFL